MTRTTRLYLVRHGQTDLNRDRRFRGMSDAPLNERGREEAAGAARLLALKSVSLVYTSPVNRAVETARIVAERLGLDVHPDDGLNDIDYGLWQGLTVEEVVERFGPQGIESWRSDPGSFIFPGGDGMSRVRERVGSALLRIARANPGAAIAAVTHMAILKVCFLSMLDLGLEWFWRVGIDNGSVSAFTYREESGFVLESWNVPPGVTGG
jgi:broad specificity phosphatase PhoE